jgi:hypothetical protein
MKMTVFSDVAPCKLLPDYTAHHPRTSHLLHHIWSYTPMVALLRRLHFQVPKCVSAHDFLVSVSGFPCHIAIPVPKLKRIYLCSSHNDLPWNIRKFLHNQLRHFRFGEDLRKVDPWSKSPWSHTDLPRLQAGLVAAQVSTFSYWLVVSPVFPSRC